MLFLETQNSNLEEVISDPLETSYAKENYFHDNIDSSSHEETNQLEDDQTIQSESKNNKDKKRLIVKPHQKRKVVRSKTQALSHLSGGMTQLIESNAKRHKAQIDFERERYKTFMEFKRDEAERNRRHELEMAKVFASAFTSFKFPPGGYSPQFQGSNVGINPGSSMFRSPLHMRSPTTQVSMHMPPVSPVYPSSSTARTNKINSNSFNDSHDWN